MSRLDAGSRDDQGALFSVEAEGPFAGVVFNRPLDQVFSYAIPKRLRGSVKVGQRVRVPLGRANQPITGYVVWIEPSAAVDPGKVKDVLEVLDDPPLIDGVMLELTRWMAGYYACSWGQALDAVVPAGVKKQAGTRIATCLIVPDEVRLCRDTWTLPSRQAEILELLCKAVGTLTVTDVCRLAKCTTAPIASLRRRGLIHTVRRRMSRAPVVKPSDPTVPEDDHDGKAPVALTSEQSDVLDRLAPSLAGDAFATFLLHGVTGSGKTEVYLSAIERVVARGKEAIVLVPEISLTPQTIRRFRRRFDRVAVLHSHLSDAERHRHWRAIASGEVQVVVGARSAIFAPARKLGLIVIDEEHESTFKQETTPRYHARDVAVKRAQLEKLPVILGSATPALETWANADRGRYTRLTLGRRVAERPMPRVDIIDMRREKPSKGQPAHALGGLMRRAMAEALDDNGQVILLLNRRGFHTFILCPKCGCVLKCGACDVALTHHKERHTALCHTCDAEYPPPDRCPSCSCNTLHYGGIGTERLEREVREAFPNHVVRRMDSDTMRSPGAYEQVLAAFRARQVHILLGTQMIAKGLDFPDVTLVGVVNADTSLHLPDFRAAERTFQLVAQVAGRTGRGERPGRVLVQTYAPDAPAISYAARHDYLGFVAQELPERKKHHYPPFGRVVRLIARGPIEADVVAFLDSFAGVLRGLADPGVLLLGPAPAPVMKIKHLFRYHLQLRAPTAPPLQALLRAALPLADPPHPIELAVDVDPVSLL
ncbi:replication restart helicase PriA [Tautonia sociabilis]|uniref:Replication restart protein PriA n=1 Tax=Tautonia sociabilis TaxID=2080755 RepID=A0A432MN32_9BACT|nr:primosomal protein N' [Tautonia sociabilis]RUL88516.1 primosomal protein N' [Tautonia sociabilis]